MVSVIQILKRFRTCPHKVSSLHSIGNFKCIFDHEGVVEITSSDFAQIYISDVSSKRRTGRSPENIQMVKNMLAEDRKLTLDSMAHLSGLKRYNIHRILKLDLGLMRKAAKYVPHMLTGPQEHQRFEVATLMLQRAHRDPTFLSTVITMDESWMYQYDPELKCNSSEWLPKGAPRPMKLLRERTTGKVLLISFDFRGVVHREFLQNATVNSQIFVRILQNLRRSIRIRRPALRKSFWLHMDNASPHTCYNTSQYLLMTGTQVERHPPYSPDLAPSDYWFFPWIKRALRGVHFPSLDALEQAVDEQISSVASHEFKLAIMVMWPKRWARCVNAQGCYFEGLD